MKKIILINFLFSIFLYSFAQKMSCFFYEAGTHPVSVYRSPYSFRTIAIVQDDTIEERFSEITILKKRGPRFYVEIKDQDPHLQPIKGWVNRRECGVFLYPNDRVWNNKYRLYINRNDKIPFMTLSERDERIQSYHHLPIIDYDTITRRVRIELELKGHKKIKVWTFDYCGSIYGCEGR